LSETGRGALFVVSAPSGAGKTSLTRALTMKLAQLSIPAAISVSYTTRAPRPGEQDGRHYHFIKPEEFNAMIQRGEFLEHANVFGQQYGTGRAATEKMLTSGADVILDIDWQGGRTVRQKAPDSVSIFILPPSLEELGRRLKERRQDGEEVIAKRMAAAREEMAHYVEYDYLVINRDFNLALDELASIFLSRRVRRPAQEMRYNTLIGQLLK
jgi:guanylate kinase